MLYKMLKKKKMDKEDLIKFGVLSGLIEVVYVVFVAGFFILSEALFPATAGSLIMGIIAFLLLLVISAGFSAVLIFGLPFYLMLQKKYKEAMIVICSSIGAMIVICILIILGEIFIY